MRDLPPNLPQLPLNPEEADGSYVRLSQDNTARWVAAIYDDEGMRIDTLRGYHDANEALGAVSHHYPNASFNPED